MFLSQAIGLLEVAIKSQPITPLHILLGKTKMKAKRYQDAIESFQQALDIMVNIHFFYVH